MNHHPLKRHLLPGIGFLVLLAGALGLMGLRPAHGLEGGPPRAILTETVHDFGTVTEDQALSYTFVVKNQGDQPLVIEDVDPDCACTVPRYDHTILPGGQGEITLTIKPFSVMRHFKKATRVLTNDPEHRLLVLTLTGVGQPLIEILPGHVVRLRGFYGQDLESQVRFISHLRGPWKITGYRTTLSDKIEVSLKTELPDRIYVLEIKNKSKEAGPYAGLIELTTTVPERPRLIVRVFGEIYLPSAGGQ
jgi:hypothetical protein